MGRDDEIAIVLYKDQWYVDQVFGGNAWRAIVNGTVFQDYREALNFASNSCDPDTEYGVCVYKNYDPTKNSRFEKAMIEKGKM